MHTLLRQSLFWDSNLESLDLQKHKRKINVRVLERVTLQDWQVGKEICGKDAPHIAIMARQFFLTVRTLKQLILTFHAFFYR